MQNISLTEKSDRREREKIAASKPFDRKEFLIQGIINQTIKSKTKIKSIISIISKTKTKKKKYNKEDKKREREGGGASTQIRGVPGHVPRCQGPVLLPSPSLPLFSLPPSVSISSE